MRNLVNKLRAGRKGGLVIRNGKQGRKPSQMGGPMRALIEDARMKGIAILPHIIKQLIIDCDHGLMFDANDPDAAPVRYPCGQPLHDCAGYRLRCRIEVMNRCGLPGMQQIQAIVQSVEQPNIELKWSGLEAVTANVTEEVENADVDQLPPGKP